MLSELLSPESYGALAAAESVTGAWLALRKTGYGAWVPEDPPGEQLGVEKIFREVTAERFRRSTRALSGKPAEVGRILLSRWDTDNLELALRLWHAGDRDLQVFLTHPSLVEEVPVFDIMEAETLEAVALMLRATSFFEPLSRSVPAYKEQKSIIAVEVALERDFYSRLLEAVRALGGTDSRRAMRVVGAEVDLINLTWLARLVRYYDLKPGEFREMMVPGPSAISRRLARASAGTGALRDMEREILGEDASPGDAAPELETIAMMERVVGENAAESARSLLAGYPFSIACVIAFYTLKRIELRNLSTVFSGKAAGRSPEEIRDRLIPTR
jgi:V/A-type H+-transporting ATPase subunit C